MIDKTMTSGRHEGGSTRLANSDEIALVHSLLAQARNACVAQAERLLQESRQLIQPYREIPVAFNPFDVLGPRSEAVHTNMLAWLLDPEADHGLGDAMLRRLLADVSATTGRVPQAAKDACVAAGNVTGNVPARTQTECVAGRGAVDLVVVVPGVVILIEVKVDAAEGRLTVGDNDNEMYQSEAYRKRFSNHWEEQSASLDDDLRHRAGPHPAIASLLVHKTGSSEPKDHQTLSLGWLTIEQHLAESMEGRQLDPPRRDLMVAFRTALIQGSGTTQPFVDVLADLRKWTQDEDRARNRPLKAIRELSSLKKRLPPHEQERDPVSTDDKTDVRTLALEHWGIVYELHGVAEEFRKDVMKRVQHNLPDFRSKGGELRWELGKPSPLSWIAVRVETAVDAPTVSITTRFAWLSGLRADEIKQALVDVDSKRLNRSASTSVVAEHHIYPKADDDAWIEELLKKVEQQKPIAQAVHDRVDELHTGGSDRSG